MNNTFTSIPINNSHTQSPSSSPSFPYLYGDSIPNQSVTSIEITNKKIINFYNLHPNIDIDEVNLYFINIISKICSNQNSDMTTSSIHSILSNSPRENVDKICQKQHFTNILSKIYTNAEITHNYLDGNYEFITMKRLKKPKVLFKNIDIDSNVSNEDTLFFNNLIDQENCCGIMISQGSGISNKNHFQIDIHKNNNIIIYLHNVNYVPSIISSAIDIVDNLYNKIQDFSKNNTSQECIISKDLLDNINNEYQLFVTQKSSLIDIVKEYQKKLLSQIDECRFTCLNSYLSEKYNTPIQKSAFTCDLCKKYSAHNLKALAAHKRGCIRKKQSL
jgi:hypothetical protein